MKLNPSFLETCKKILEKSQVKIHFEFLIGQAQGLIYPQVDRLVHQYLGGAVTVHPHLDYASYMKVIASCDMFINPFPFGNTNGIIDTITCCLVGVCKTGAEVHEHIDQGLFERLEFPEWLVTTTNDEYVDAVIRLAQDHELRISLSRKLSGEGNLYKIFNGRPLIMSMKFQQLLTAN
jgi:predicted O-linked N-acetylglucosamine transferase (SPINDLY family)